MRLALVLLGALALTGSAAAGGPSVKNVPFKVAVPKHGKQMLYAFKLTVGLPAGTTLTGAPPISAWAKNAKALPPGLQAASLVVRTGNATWEAFIAVNAQSTTGSGAGTLAGELEIPPPLSANSDVITPEKGACTAFLEIIGQHSDDTPNYTLIAGKKTNGAKGIVAGACP